MLLALLLQVPSAPGAGAGRPSRRSLSPPLPEEETRPHTLERLSVGFNQCKKRMGQKKKTQVNGAELPEWTTDGLPTPTEFQLCTGSQNGWIFRSGCHVCTNFPGLEPGQRPRMSFIQNAFLEVRSRCSSHCGSGKATGFGPAEDMVEDIGDLARRSSTLSQLHLSQMQHIQGQKPVVGMANQGNTCYLNSLMQSLFALDVVREKVLGDTITDASPNHMVQIKSIFKLLDAGTQVSFDKSRKLTNALHAVLLFDENKQGNDKRVDQGQTVKKTGNGISDFNEWDMHQQETYMPGTAMTYKQCSSGYTLNYQMDPTELFNQLNGRNKAFEAFMLPLLKMKKLTDNYLWPKTAYDNGDCYPQVRNAPGGAGVWVGNSRDEPFDKPGENSQKIVIVTKESLCPEVLAALNEEEGATHTNLFGHCKVVGGEVDDNGNCAEDGPFPEFQSATYLDAIGKDDASYHYFHNEHFPFADLMPAAWIGKDVPTALQAETLEMFQRRIACEPKMCEHKFAEFGLEAVRGWEAVGDVLAIGINRDKWDQALNNGEGGNAKVPNSAQFGEGFTDAQGRNWELKSLAGHQGGGTGGHWVAYVKRTVVEGADAAWYMISDTQVVQLPSFDFMRNRGARDVRVLFYERRRSPSVVVGPRRSSSVVVGRRRSSDITTSDSTVSDSTTPGDACIPRGEVCPWDLRVDDETKHKANRANCCGGDGTISGDMCVEDYDAQVAKCMEI